MRDIICSWLNVWDTVPLAGSRQRNPFRGQRPAYLYLHTCKRLLGSNSSGSLEVPYSTYSYIDSCKPPKTGGQPHSNAQRRSTDYHTKSRREIQLPVAHNTLQCPASFHLEGLLSSHPHLLIDSIRKLSSLKQNRIRPHVRITTLLLPRQQQH